MNVHVNIIMLKRWQFALHVIVVIECESQMTGAKTQREKLRAQVGNDQEKAQSERDSHSKNRGGKKTKSTLRHLYHEYIIVSRMSSYFGHSVT